MKGTPSLFAMVDWMSSGLDEVLQSPPSLHDVEGLSLEMNEMHISGNGTLTGRNKHNGKNDQKRNSWVSFLQGDNNNSDNIRYIYIHTIYIYIH